MNRTPLIIGGVVILAIAATILAITGGGLYSVIGEEGYTPYDPLLLGGSFDHNKWLYTGTTYDNTPFGCVGSATSCNGGTQACSSQLTSYQGVTAGINSITINPLGYGRNGGYQGPYVRTANLRLINFKTEWSVSVTRCSSNKYIHGGGVLTTNRGTVYSYPEGSGTSPTGPVGIELLWDDYELGHYQIKANGIIVQEGIVAEGQELYFQIEPDTASCNSECSGTATLSNPRVQELFNCDLQEGEVKAHTCTAGPSVVRLRDLDGFKRFCTSLPATFSDAGLATSSKRVYYELAKNEPVIIEENQIWEFQYIADGDDVGASTSDTGIVELCEGPLFIEDLNDLPVPNATVTDTTLHWTSNGRYDGNAGFRTKNTDLTSGNLVFMSTSPLTIDDKKCPYRETRSEYPGIDRTCVSVTAFGKTFRDGDEKQIAPGLNLKLEDLNAQYRDDDGDDLYRWSATWRLEFAKNAVSIKQGTGPEEVVLTNTLPGPVTIILTSNHKIGSIDENIIDTQTLTLKAGASRTVTIPFHNEYTGTTTLTVRPTIQTIAGGIAQEALTVTYQGDATNQSEAANPPTETSNDTRQGTESRLASFFKNIWAWITGLFGA